MSTYTDLRNRVKENITVGYAADDRTTIQKVKFHNEGNEYWGTFTGKISVDNVIVGSGTLTDVSVYNSYIKNATLVNADGIKINLTELGEGIDEISNVTIPAVKNEVKSISAYLSSEISGKVSIGTYSSSANPQYCLSAGNLSVVRISDQDYYSLISAKTVNPDIIYTISSDNMNVYGQRIISVADPVSSMDAVNLQSMSAAIPTGMARLASIALSSAPSFDSILSGDGEDFIKQFDVNSISSLVSVLLDVKRVFANLSAV